MRARRTSRRSNQRPHRDRNRSACQDGRSDEPFPHLVESVCVPKVPDTRSCTANRGNPMISFTAENGRRQGEPMPRQRIEPACPAKTISKVSPTWVASMAARPACPSHRRVHVTASAMRTSWQSATSVKPIRRRRRPNQNSAQGRAANGGWYVFWIYWNTAWSLIISGIMVATIVSHPDAEFVEVQAARRSM